MNASAGPALWHRYRDPDLTELGLRSDVIDLQVRHRSIRAYLPDPVPDEALTAIVAAAQSASTTSNLQAWSVVVVRDEARKARLAKLAAGQAFIEQAPVLLVWLVDLARLRRLADDNGAPLAATDYLETTIIGFVDVGLAAQNATLAAESLGLGVVFIGAMRDHPESVAEELHLPPSTFAAFGMSLGFSDPAQPADVKPRLPQVAVVHEETYDLDKQPAAVAVYEERMASFYAEQDLAVSWTERVLNRLGGPQSLKGRDRLREALTAQGLPSR
jgi:nitroreductase